MAQSYRFNKAKIKPNRPRKGLRKLSSIRPRKRKKRNKKGKHQEK